MLVPLSFFKYVYFNNHMQMKKTNKRKTPTDFLESTNIMGLFTNRTDINYNREQWFAFMKILKTTADL